ncbi:MAG: hypothetical protein V1706_14555 [Pseudomonadota bacterium]
MSGLFMGTAVLQGQETADKPVAKTQITEEEYSEKVNELARFLSGKTDNFEYKRVNRSDPFMPFISEQVVATEEEIPEEELFGMRKFEPGQLSLVAIVLTEEGPVAMVQDSVGKGYVLRNGTEIGRTGTVDRISDNVVVVKQWYKTTAGEERYSFVEMLLKREGEK